MGLPRLICQFLTGRRPESPMLPSTAAAAAVPSQECCCDGGSRPEADEDCSCSKECWRDDNNLSVSTRASSNDQATSLRNLQLGSLESDSEGETAEAHRTEAAHHACCAVPLISGLFAYGPASEDEADERGEAPLLRAESAKGDESGSIVSVVATNRSRSQVVSTSPDSLLVDCRAQADDEPQLVSLVGSRLRAGRVKRLRIEPVEADGEHNVQSKEELRVVCLCEAPLLMELGHLPKPVPLKEAVEELCEQQVQRNNAKLVAYQREINARMLGAQRRRLLGLAEPQASALVDCRS